MVAHITNARNTQIITYSLCSDNYCSVAKPFGNRLLQSRWGDPSVHTLQTCIVLVKPS